MAKKSIKIVELSSLSSCLPGFENKELPKGIYHKITARFYHKSGAELRLEAQQKMKLLNVSTY